MPRGRLLRAILINILETSMARRGSRGLPAVSVHRDGHFRRGSSVLIGGVEGVGSCSGWCNGGAPAPDTADFVDEVIAVIAC